MTDRRRTLSRSIASAARTALCTAVGASLIGGCGALPGNAGGSGEPLTVMTWAPENTKATNMPGMPAMAKAYARWVNARGGINGRELRVLTCNEENTPKGAAGCARQAVEADVVAVVGSYSQHGRSYFAPLEAAGIPFIGGFGASAEEFQSTLSYPVNGGQPTLLAGTGHQLGRVCSKVALVRPDTLPGDTLPLLLNAGLKSAQGAEDVPSADIRAADDATDYSDAARRALSAAGTRGGQAAAGGSGKGCVTAALGEHTETFFDSFRRVDEDGSKVKIASVLGSISQGLVNRTGGKNGPFEGAYVTGWYPVASDPLWEPMRQVISKQAFADDRVDPTDVGTQTTWIAYTVFTEIVKSLGDEEVTARRIARALDDTEGVKTGGLTPALRWRYEDMRAVGGFPRIVNGRVTFQQVKGGVLVTQGDGAMDMTRTLESAPTSS
ncbi:ABC transporter substrate-binding protein [Streptomyces bambusae]|uniref:ABC transporter substrate-binding protein n=1 Tax=Streptomyces bambusae TaxID=1550616 RepID=UPI001CFF4325|nr:ABC transporter substrate-binding protein [Streptomyces bambusae]MCB5167593.1 ABC transporter substrate-binding protein [Streptomyces bambusae]